MYISWSVPWLSLLLLCVTETSVALDMARSGNYLILQCGAGLPNSKAAHLQILLQETYASLQAAIADARLGTSSKHGFSSFFKTNDNQAAVIALFQDIAAGSNFIKPSQDSSNGQPSSTPPTLVCVDQGDPETAHLWRAYCNHSSVVAIHRPFTGVVALCPSFWSLNTDPGKGDCPAVIGSRRSRRFDPNSGRLVHNQYAALIHDLTHVYVPATETVADVTTGDGASLQDNISREPYRIQDVVELNATQSVLSAANYAYYAAGRFFLESCSCSGY